MSPGPGRGWGNLAALKSSLSDTETISSHVLNTGQSQQSVKKQTFGFILKQQRLQGPIAAASKQGTRFFKEEK